MSRHATGGRRGVGGGTRARSETWDPMGDGAPAVPRRTRAPRGAAMTAVVISARVIVAACLPLVALALACASSGVGRARSLVSKDRGAEALPILEELALREPNNGEVFDLMGRAHYRAGRFDRAEAALTTAQSLGVWSAEGVLYRGLMREREGDLDGAIRIYQSYQAIPSRVAQRKIKGRIRLIMRQRLREEAATLVKEETRAGAPDRSVVTVFPFRYIGVSRELGVLGKGLAEFLTTDLAKVRSLRVVERSRIAALMEEIGLGSSGLVDDRTALRMGRITGAGTVVNGVYRDFTGGVSIESAVADVAKGLLDNLRPASGRLESVFDMEKGIVFDAITRLGVELTEVEREDIARTPTRSLLAFLEFCRGLAAEDAGDWAKAYTHYRAASKADPRFKEAAAKADQFEDTDRVASDLTRFEREFLAEVTGSAGGEGDVGDERAGSGGGQPGDGEEGAEAGEAGVEEETDTADEETAASDAASILDDLADVVTGPIDPGEGSREPSVGGEAESPTILIDINFP